MVCSVGDLEVSFPSTGVRIRPYSVDYKVQQGRLEYSKLEVSRAAGDLVADIVESDPIPAVLSINGSEICRLCADEDSVSHVGDGSWISLQDPRTVLSSGHIEWEPTKTTLGEAVEYIYERARDPNKVLVGLNVIGAVERAETERVYIDGIQRWLDRNYPDWVKNLRSPFSGEPIVYTERLEGGFRFRGATPMEAISEIQSEFAVDSWVTAEGVLTLGYPGEQARVGLVGEQYNDLRLSGHHIVEKAVPISSVAVRGTYRDMVKSELGPIKYNGGYKDFQVNSTAKYEGASRDRVLLLGPRKVEGVKALEQIALNQLRKSISSSAEGSLTINAAASGESTLAPADLDLGDILMVPEIERPCHQEVRAGIYTVTGLNHSISAADGWTVNVSVSRFIPETDIDTYSEISGPGSDEWYDADEFAEKMLE